LRRGLFALARVAAFGALGVLVCACGPKTSELLDGHHYREATCAVTQGAASRDEVASAMSRALDPRLHVEVISDEVLATVAPGTTPDMRARVLLVRVRIATNDIPIDHLELSLASKGDVSARPMDLPALAGLTGERVPPNHTVVTTHTLENIVSAGVAIFSLGLLDPGQRGPSTTETPPTDDEWQAAAPTAFSVAAAFPSRGCTERKSGTDDAPRIGASCEASLLVERRAGGSLVLDLGVAYQAERLRKNEQARYGVGESDRKCRVEERVRVPLGPVATLAQSTAATFGTRYRGADEIGHAVTE
jgi:hypothetical protein